MILRLSLVETVALFIAAILMAGLVLRLLLRWRHAAAVGRARRLADRLRTPATTLAAVEEQAGAVEELCELPDMQAAVAAARELLGVADATVRSAAIEILRRTRALDLWVRDLRRGNYRAKIQAVQALGEIGDERAVEALIEALGDDDPDVARAASQAVILRDPDYACEQLAEALGSPQRRIAETAAATLVRMGEEAVEALVGQLTSLNAQARRLAVESLGATGGSGLSGVLLPMLDRDPLPAVRVAVAEALCRISADGVHRRLREAARSDPDWFVRARALSLLAEVNAPGAAEFLTESLADIETSLTRCGDDSDDVEVIAEGSRRIRSAIVAGLRMLGLSEEEIAAAAVRDRQDDEALALDKNPGEDDWITIAGGLRNRDPVQRGESARRLGEVGRQAVAPLRRALHDPHPLVRAEAARALGRIGASDCLEALAECLQDPDSEVRLAVSNAMRGIVMREAAPELPASEPEADPD